MSVASVDEVATSLGRPIATQAEVQQVQLWLDDAEMQIRLRLGDVSLLDQEVLSFVEREAVVLKVRNPDAKESESIDDYRYQRTDTAAKGQVQILDEWWNMLTPDGSGGAFSITAAGDPYWSAACSPTDPAWWPL
jgi:hypothetical protein